MAEDDPSEEEEENSSEEDNSSEDGNNDSDDAEAESLKLSHVAITKLVITKSLQREIRKNFKKGEKQTSGKLFLKLLKKFLKKEKKKMGEERLNFRNVLILKTFTPLNLLLKKKRKALTAMTRTKIQVKSGLYIGETP